GKQFQAIRPDAPTWGLNSRNQSRGHAIGIRSLSNIVAAHLPTSKVHELRHTFTVDMLRDGAPLTDVADHLGHTDIKITRLYAKELTGDENKYGEQLGQGDTLQRRRCLSRAEALAPRRQPDAIGHSDWVCQNLRFNEGGVCAAYDWDSLLADSEPVLVGVVAG